MSALWEIFTQMLLFYASVIHCWWCYKEKYSKTWTNWRQFPNQEDPVGIIYCKSWPIVTTSTLSPVSSFPTCVCVCVWVCVCVCVCVCHCVSVCAHTQACMCACTNACVCANTDWMNFICELFCHKQFHINSFHLCIMLEDMELMWMWILPSQLCRTVT